MPVQVCPRCQKANPGDAAYCHFDGIGLQGGRDAGGAQVINRLPQEFVFPSGKRCKTFDDFAGACEEEWEAARDLLKKGAFEKYFSSVGRLDLAQSSQSAVAQADADVALTTFLGDLPTTRTQPARLDLFPRRFMLGNLQAGQNRQLQLTVSNKGKGLLRGVLKVTEGGDWLKVGPSASDQVPVKTDREQPVNLQIDTRKLQAAKSYAGKLTVITNGGVVEVPVRLAVVAQPFPRPPFQGVRTPREMAEKMRDKPKAAVPLLESGEIARWFAGNQWEFPVRGTLAKGIAGVQQFFEAMGLSKPPKVQVTPAVLQVACKYPQAVQHQIAIQTNARKWVYASVESDSPWLRVLTPSVSGPQQASIAVAVDSRQIQGSRPVEARLRIVANAGQTLTVPVRAVVQGAPKVSRGGLLQPVIVMALVFLLLRLFIAPALDFYGRGAAVRHAFAKKTNLTPDQLTLRSPLRYAGGWLTLPWRQILFARGGDLKPSDLDPGMEEGAQAAFQPIPVTEFRHYYVTYLVRLVVVLSWWIGAVLGVLIVLRSGGKYFDMLWGLIAGAVAGGVVAATLACASIIVETVPHFLWDVTLRSGNGLLLLIWTLLALCCWAGLGALIGLVCGVLPPVRNAIVKPVQAALSGLLGVFGLNKWAVYFAAP